MQGNSALSPFHSQPLRAVAVRAARCRHRRRRQKRSEGIWNDASKNSLLTLMGQMKAEKGWKAAQMEGGIKGRGK